MPVPNSIDDLEPVPADNYPAGSEPVFPNLDNYLRSHAAFIAQLRDSQGDADTKIETAEEDIEALQGAVLNTVKQTGATGVVLLPEGNDAQRPDPGSIPAGAFVMRGNTQDPADYQPEFWNRAAAAWQAFASRPWVTALTDALGVRVSALESAPKPVAPGSAPQFVPRAWVRFSGSTILASGNISSVAKSSNGVFVANLITPVVDVNCAAVCTASAGQAARMSIAAEMASTTQCRMAFHVVGTGDTDPSVASLIIVR